MFTFLDHPTVKFLMPWRWQQEFQNVFFWSMQSMADVVLLRISVGSFPSFQLGVDHPNLARPFNDQMMFWFILTKGTRLQPFELVGYQYLQIKGFDPKCSPCFTCFALPAITLFFLHTTKKSPEFSSQSERTEVSQSSLVSTQQPLSLGGWIDKPWRRRNPFHYWL